MQILRKGWFKANHIRISAALFAASFTFATLAIWTWDVRSTMQAILFFMAGFMALLWTF